MRVLVAEDNRASRTLLEKILKKMDHRVTLTENGREAWEEYKENSYDMVFLNWDMPKMGGLELTKKIKKGDNPYVFMVTSEGEGVMLEALRAGVDDFVVKPYQRDFMRSRIEKADKLIGGIEPSEEFEFDAVDELEEEHEILRRMLRVFRAVRSKIDDELSQIIADWISDTAFIIDSKIHHEKEMEYLLAFLDKAIQEQGESPGNRLFNRASLKTVEEEHEKIESLLDKLQDSVIEYSNGENTVEDVKNQIDRYISLWEEHIDREERFLFPLSRKYLEEDDMKELKVEFDRIEEESEKGTERIDKELSRAEDVLNIG